MIRCINNIISNAIKFSYPDSTIDIKAIKRDNNIEIQVSDTGTGIKKDELEKIFSGSVSKKGTFGETGRGIGLRMIKEDIENNNGEIKIESTEGKGTTVFIVLPA